MYYALWIENTRESDPCSYELTKAVAKGGEGGNPLESLQLHANKQQNIA